MYHRLNVSKFIKTFWKVDCDSLLIYFQFLLIESWFTAILHNEQSRRDSNSNVHSGVYQQVVRSTFLESCWKMIVFVERACRIFQWGEMLTERYLLMVYNGYTSPKKEFIFNVLQTSVLYWDCRLPHSWNCKWRGWNSW